MRFFQSAAFVMAFLTLSLPAAEPAHVTLVRAPNGGIQPQAAVDSNGTVHLIYFKGEPGAGDIYYVRRERNANQFSEPIRVNTQPGSAIAVGTIRGAQLALGRNGRVHVAWNGHAPKNGTYMQAPMLYTRLNEAGTAFEPERNVITFAGGLDGGGSVAADQSGNVYVMWHAPKPGNTNGEAGRALFVARSVDDGKKFAREKLAISEPTGACGCCGMRAFADAEGNVFALYRAASEKVNRAETLLISRDHGDSFQIAYAQNWKIATCPMSSAFISETRGEALVAAETHGRVFFVRVDAKTGKVSSPVSPEVKGKYPVAVANSQGQVLLAWAEGTAWAKGGSLAWQLFDANGNPVSEIKTAAGLPAWSLPAAYSNLDGNFTIVW